MTRNGQKSRLSRWVITGLLLLLLGVGLAACGSSDNSSSESGSAETGAEVSKAGNVNAEIESLTLAVPIVGESIATTRISTQPLGLTLLALEPLLRYKEGAFEPDLAESYKEVSTTEFTFQLRKGVKFWDGTALTPEDVLYSYRLHFEPGTESYLASQWSTVSSVTAKGWTIIVKLNSPNPQFLDTVSQTGVVSQKYAEENGSDLGSPSAKNMGSGPYEFGTFKASVELELIRNEKYWGKEPHIGRIKAEVLSPNNLLLASQAGELDGVFNVPGSQVVAMEGVPNFSLTSGVENSIYKLSFAVTKSPWSDIHLRRALAYCINREAIADAVFPKGGEAAIALVPPSVAEAVMSKQEVDTTYSNLESIVPSFDLEKAKEEIAKSAVPQGLSTTVDVIAADPNLSAIAQIIGQEAEKIGIHINIKEVDETTYYNNVYFQHSNEGLTIDNFSSDGPNPINIPRNALSSETALPDGSGINSANYENATVDKLIGEYMALPAESAGSGPLLAQILEDSSKDLPYGPVAFPAAIMALSSEYSYPEFNSFWWMENWTEDLGLAAN